MSVEEMSAAMMGKAPVLLIRRSVFGLIRRANLCCTYITLGLKPQRAKSIQIDEGDPAFREFLGQSRAFSGNGQRS